MDEGFDRAAAHGTVTPLGDDDVVVSLKDVSLYYKLYEDPKYRLREALNPFGRIYHRKFFALRDVTLDVTKGTVLGIVGRNGSGKSTLLKIIARVLQPATGAVSVRGDVRALLELGAGFNPDFSGLENIYFMGSVYGFSKAEMKEKVEEIAAFADIGDYIRQPIKTYSSGMRARLAFAVSVSVNPDIFIVDEVLAVGDDLFRRKCYARIEEILAENKTVFFVSHSVAEVNRICTRAILIDKGEILLDGPPKLVTAKYQRLIFSSKEAVEDIRREIRQVNADNELKERVAKEVEGEEGKSPLQETDSLSWPGEANDKVRHGLEPFYVDGLVAEGRMEDGEGASITGMAITTLDGKRVNMLVMNEDYIVSFRVRFRQRGEKVFFGARFVTLKGLPVSGLRSDLAGLTVDRVDVGDEYHVKYRFSCYLRPGTYSIHLTTGQTGGGEVAILARVADGLLFKVISSYGSEFYGLVNLNQRISIERC